jgi:sugar lactone lactonase YvrE
VKWTNVVAGVLFGEGPVWRPATQDLVVTSAAEGILWQIDPGSGVAIALADVGGGLSGAALCSDGGLLVTQNGGYDFIKLGFWNDEPQAAGDRAAVNFRPVEPGIQRVSPSGDVEYLSTTVSKFRAPSDLAALTDGSVLFTDPCRWPPKSAPSRLYRLHAHDGGTDDTYMVDLVFETDNYLNGLGVDSRGWVLLVEGRGLRWLTPDGDRPWFVEQLPGHGDGLAFDVDDRVYVCMPDVGVGIIEPDGAITDILSTSSRFKPHNCCFGGNDLATLFVTDSVNDAVVAWSGISSPGRDLPAYRIARKAKGG